VEPLATHRQASTEVRTKVVPNLGYQEFVRKGYRLVLLDRLILFKPYTWLRRFVFRNGGPV